MPTTKVDERAPDMTEPVDVAEETRPREELMRQTEITSTALLKKGCCHNTLRGVCTPV